MKKFFYFLLLVSLFSCNPETPSKPLIITSIFPLKDLIANIAGESFEVRAMIKPGESPHTYSPDTQDAKLLEQAVIFFKIGLSGLEVEQNMEKFVNSEKTKIYDVHDGIPLLPFAAHGHKHSHEDKHSPETIEPHGHHQEGHDPHIWLSPRNARQIIKNIKTALSELYPQQKGIFDENFTKYDQELAALDQEISELLKPLQNNSFLEFHPAWTYFARDYQLTIAVAIQERPGHEDSTSLGEIKELMVHAKKMRAKAVFIEPQFNPELSKKIAAELGLGVAILDPLGGSKDTDSYIKIIRINTQNIIKAFK